MTKKRPKLAKMFKCPFCSNENTVECKMDNKKGIGSLTCRLCGAAYQMPIHHLHEPIDVFSEWLDDCEAAANPSSAAATSDNMQEEDGGGGAAAAAVPRYQEEDDDDDDDELPEGSGLSRRGGDTSNSNKKPAAKGSSSQQQQYEDLGLDDSDDD